LKAKFPPLVRAKETEYETTPDRNWDIRKRTWEGGKGRFSFNGDTNGNKGCTFWSAIRAAFNTRNVAAARRPMVLQQKTDVSQ